MIPSPLTGISMEHQRRRGRLSSSMSQMSGFRFEEIGCARCRARRRRRLQRVHTRSILSNNNLNESSNAALLVPRSSPATTPSDGSRRLLALAPPSHPTNSMRRSSAARSSSPVPIRPTGRSSQRTTRGIISTASVTRVWCWISCRRAAATS